MSYLVVKLNIHVLPKTTAVVIACGLGIAESLRRKMTSDMITVTN